MCDAGSDYTNRNNYTAHHIVFSASEIPDLANPAEILAQWDGWVSVWTGAPEFIGEPEGVDKIRPKNSLPAAHWRRRFGSAAKAALLDKSGVLILAEVSDAREILNLFSESLLLNIDPSDAWNFTFTTCFGSGETPSDFLWKTFASKSEIPSGDVINFTDKTSPEAPFGRAAEYAETGVKTNRETLNLKVSAPAAPKRFNVVEKSDERKFSPAALYAASALITVFALVLIFAFFTGASEEKQERAEKPSSLPVLEIRNTSPSAALQKSAPKKPLSKVVESVRAEIEADRFSEAIAAWDSSAYAASNAAFREDILADIGSRADAMMRFADGVLSLPNSTAADRQKAIYNIRAARKALDIAGISRKEQREEKWNSLNSRIEK